MILLFHQPAPFFFLNSSLPLHPPKKTKPTILPQNLTQTYEYNALSESRPALWENRFQEKQEADLSSRESRDGAEQKATELGGKRSTESWLLLVTYWQFHLIADLWTGWASVLPYLFSLLRISVNLVNYYTGESKALQPRQSPVQGNDVSFPPPTSPCSANPPLLWPVNIPPPPVPLPWGGRAPGQLSVSYCATESICQGIRTIFCFEKSLQWKWKCLSTSKIMLSQQKLGQSPEEQILNRNEVNECNLAKGNRRCDVAKGVIMRVRRPQLYYSNTNSVTLDNWLNLSSFTFC